MSKLIFFFYRACPVNKLYIMVREKKDKNPQARLNEMFSTPVSINYPPIIMQINV